MIDWIHRTIIVPNNSVQLARDLSFILAGSGGSEMYNVPLVSKENPNEITHWISSGFISKEFSDILPLIQILNGEQVRVQGNISFVVTKANENGMKVSEQEVKDLFDQSYVYDIDPFECLNLTGLKLID